MSNVKDSPTPSDRSSVASQATDHLRDRAGDAADALKGIGAKASAATQDMSDKAVDLVGTAKDKASDAGDKVNDALEGQKAAGAERVKGISAAIRRAADELEHEMPPAATYIRRAADEIDAMTDAVQRRDVRQLLGDVQSFAKRQPAAFLGATVLGGFAIMRLLKAPTAVHEASSSSTSASPSTKGSSLVVAGAPFTRDDATIGGKMREPGGIPPVASGFAAPSGSTIVGSRDDR